MKKSRFIFISVLLLLLFAVFSPAAAQNTEQEEFSISLSAIGLQEFSILIGPYDEIDLEFQIPAYMELTTDAILTLNIRSVFSSFITAQGDENYGDIIAGSLEITANDILVENYILQGEGQNTSLDITLNKELMNNAQSGIIHLNLFWNGSISCDLNLTTAIQFQPGSSLSFDYRETTPDYQLNTFPRPFSASLSLLSTPTYVLLPEPALEADMEAAVIIAMGFGRLSNSQMNLHLLSPDEVSTEVLSQGNLVIIGKNSAVQNSIDEFTPLLTGLSDGQGFIGITNSPYNQRNAVLLVSASSDEALAATATLAASGVFLADSSGKYSILDALASEPNPAEYVVDTDLSNFSDKDLFFTNYGKSSLVIPFYTSADQQIGIDATFSVHFSHSTLIDYLQSGITLTLNDAAISSIRFSDSTANNSQIEIVLPNTLILPGENILQLDIAIHPLNICTNPRDNNNWIKIRQDSSLHLPLSKEELIQLEEPSLLNYYKFIDYSKTETSTILAAPLNDFDMMDSVLQFALYLGQGSKGLDEFLRFMKIQDLSPEVSGDASIIAFSTNSELEASGLNEWLPAKAEGAFLSIPGEPILNITPDENTAYIQLLTNPGNKDAFILSVSSNTAAGIQNAINNLISENLDITPGDNLFILQDDFMQSFFVKTEEADETDLPSDQEDSLDTGKPPWLLPVLILASAAVLGLATLETTRWIQNIRSR